MLWGCAWRNDLPKAYPQSSLEIVLPTAPKSKGTIADSRLNQRDAPGDLPAHGAIRSMLEQFRALAVQSCRSSVFEQFKAVALAVAAFLAVSVDVALAVGVAD